MGRLPSAALVVHLLLSIGLASQSGVPPGLAKARAQFLASLAKGDQTAAQVMTDDFVWISPNGQIRDKATWPHQLKPTKVIGGCSRVGRERRRSASQREASQPMGRLAHTCKYTVSV